MSALFMSEVLGWRLVGLYDGESVYLAEGWSQRHCFDGTAVYVDLDIARSAIPSIGHHILTFDLRTSLDRIREIHSQSVNPNLLRGISLKGSGTAKEKRFAFAQKYPFGTIHMLLACYSDAGLYSERPDRDALSLLLNVDSALQNAFQYQKNALEWLHWLGADDEKSALAHFCKWLQRIPGGKLLEIAARSDEILKEAGLGGATYSKGRKQRIPIRSDGAILERILKVIADVTGWPINANDDLLKGRWYTLRMSRNSCTATKEL